MRRRLPLSPAVRGGTARRPDVTDSMAHCYLLTYALAREGLEEGKAAGKDGKTTLEGWLQYAVDRVPQLHEGIRNHTLKSAGDLEKAERGIEPAETEENFQLLKSSLQQPSLFDFKKKHREFVLA